MITLGIESTAHTFGAGVVKDGEVLSNVRDMYIPEEGGIHPREAADHHVEKGAGVVRKALTEASVTEKDLDLVAFARGPGLGPCLRVGATIARVISLKNGIPILGVNHCVAHLEIGSMLGCQDPVLLYTSGANTQIIAYVRGRYRVLGETLDIGIGNMLDKLGREVGIPFPAGPGIEKLARGESIPGVWEADNGGAIPGIIELPYSVKGMDVSFSGLMTAALNHYNRGVDLPIICRSVQETAFSMLCEVAERAMAHIGSEELLLGGGVACNGRLKEMAGIMVRERGGKSYAPPPSLAVDNGAMMAYLGEIMHRSGEKHQLTDTVIDQKFRTDMVDVRWKEMTELGSISTPGVVDPRIGGIPSEGDVIGRGAEAVTSYSSYHGLPSVLKKRIRKGYRIDEIERPLVASRIRREVRMLQAVRETGIRTPYVLDLNETSSTITLEYLPGPRLASILNVSPEPFQISVIRNMGRIVGRMHSSNIVHGDLTTSNFIVLDDREDVDLGLIDCSLSEKTEEPEKMGVDLRLFFEVFASTHERLLSMEDRFWEGYSSENPNWREVRERLRSIEARGRYL
ncbi:MAG: bifunctional N(6)-L-threonylcarbamoyladenine synthase/serine/threonine protein kinase [Thermoplasmatota archaeon]